MDIEIPFVAFKVYHIHLTMLELVLLCIIGILFTMFLVEEFEKYEG